MSSKIHYTGRYLYRARIGVRVHASQCGATDSLHAPVIGLLDNVTCARCISSVKTSDTNLTSASKKGT